MTRLDGKSILVTGASRGIGAAIARVLASAGATVGLGYKASSDAARALAHELEGEHHLVHLDLTDSASVHAAVKTFVETTGRIDGLVNTGNPTLSSIEQAFKPFGFRFGLIPVRGSAVKVYPPELDPERLEALSALVLEAVGGKTRATGM